MEASNIPISTPSSTKNSAIDPWMQAMQNSKKDAGIWYWDMGKVEQESVANIIKKKQNEFKEKLDKMIVVRVYPPPGMLTETSAVRRHHSQRFRIMVSPCEGGGDV